MQNKKKLFAALAVAGVVAAGGSAFTDSVALGNSTAVGYGSQFIDGATAQDVHYNVNGTGDQITSVDLVLNGDFRPAQTGKRVAAAFDNADLTTCTQTDFVPVYNGGVDENDEPIVIGASSTSFRCAIGTATEGSQALHVSVTDAPKVTVAGQPDLQN